jgi:hypothetical protein
VQRQARVVAKLGAACEREWQAAGEREGRLTRAALGSALAVAAAISLWYAARSLWLGFFGLVQPLPDFDQWAFIGQDFLQYLDGAYRWVDLFAAVNEHRIVTTRLVLFADAILFQMRGVFPILFSYATLAAIAGGIAVIAAETRRAAAAIFLIGLGFLWSTCQWYNLASAFQVSMALVHLLALVAIVAATRSGALWLIAAAGADFFAIFTLGSGLFLIVPLAAAAVWMWRVDRRFLLLAGLHAVLTAIYLEGTLPTLSPVYGFSPLRSATLVAEFIGLPAGTAAVALGALGLVVFAALVGVLTFRAARRRANDTAVVVLAALAMFVVIEAAVISYARFGYGVGASRYATASLVFWAATLAAAWRMIGHLCTVPLIAAACVLTVYANMPDNEAAWRGYVSVMDKVRRDMAAGDLTAEALAPVFLAPPSYLPDAIHRLREANTGPLAR